MPSAIIIGAGPAGASTAITLAKAGWRVDLLEGKSFPRAKVCGEFISPAATPIIERLIAPTDLRAAGARQVNELFIDRGDAERRWPMPRPAWALSRASLDVMLLDRAAAAGAIVHQPAVVRSASYADDHVAVELIAGGRLSADILIHADGSGRHDPAGPTPMRAGVVGLKTHLATSVRGLRMRAAAGTGLAAQAYVGLVAVEHGLATCALVASAAMLARFCGHHDALLTHCWPGYDPRTRERAGDLGNWLACGVAGSGYIPPGHPRSFRVGNAAAAVEPVGGEGIGLALWAGSTLSATLTVAPLDLAAVHAAFARDYRRRLRTRRWACRLAAEVMMRPTLASVAWPALAWPSLTIRPWYALTGKPLHASAT